MERNLWSIPGTCKQSFILQPLSIKRYMVFRMVWSVVACSLVKSCALPIKCSFKFFTLLWHTSLLSLYFSPQYWVLLFFPVEQVLSSIGYGHPKKSVRSMLTAVTKTKNAFQSIWDHFNRTSAKYCGPMTNLLLNKNITITWFKRMIRIFDNPWNGPRSWLSAQGKAEGWQSWPRTVPRAVKNPSVWFKSYY